MKVTSKNKLKDFRKNIIALLASNAFKAATLAPLTLGIVACEIQVTNEAKEESFTVSIGLSDDLKDEKVGASVDLLDSLIITIKNNKDNSVLVDGRKLKDIQNDLTKFDIVVNGNIRITNDDMGQASYIVKNDENKLSVSGSIVYNGQTFNIDRTTISFTPKKENEEGNGNGEITKPGNGGNNENGGTGTEEGGTNPPVNPPVTKDFAYRVDQLEKVLKENNLLSGETYKGQTLTLTAQTIKLLYDVSSDSDNKLIDSLTYDKIKTDYYGVDVSTDIPKFDGALLDAYKNKNLKINTEINKSLQGVIGIKRRYNNSSVDWDNYDCSLQNKDLVYSDADKITSYIISGGKDNIIDVKLSGIFDYKNIDIKKGSNINISFVNDIEFTILDDIIDEDTDIKYLLNSKGLTNLYKDINSLIGKDVNYETIIKSDTIVDGNDYVFPKLSFNIYDHDYDNRKSDSLKDTLDIVSLFKLYTETKNSNKLNNLRRLYNVSVDSSTTQGLEINGRAYEKDNTTSLLFAEDGNTVKETGVPTLSMKTYFNLTEYDKHEKYYTIHKKGHLINSVSNFKITNIDYTNDKDINTGFTNVIFTDDMSGFTNSSKANFNGVVYFQNKNYNMKVEDKGLVWTNGILKLDNLTNTEYMAVIAPIIDFRNVGKDDIIEYNSTYVRGGKTNDKNFMYNYPDTMYFREDVLTDLKNNFDNMVYKFYKQSDDVSNVFSGETKIFTDVKGIVHSKKPRTLEEFEYFGNNGHFETSAYDSYTQEELNDLTSYQVESLENDKESKTLALINNKRVDFSDPDVKKIIFSTLKDRQYNV